MKPTKAQVRKAYNTLAELAEKHLNASIEFKKIQGQYYGFVWDEVPSLQDSDSIIDTIDYGYDSLTFDEFDKLLENAKKQGLDNPNVFLDDSDTVTE